MPQYSVSQLIGKTLYAKKEVPLFATTGSTKPYAIVKPGNYIGILNSWIEKNGVLYFLFKYGAGEQFVIKYETGAVDTSNLAAQGAKTVEQERKAEEEKQLLQSGFSGKFEYFIKKYGLYLIGAILASQAIKGYLNKK
jgi:hypothetical protein